MDVYSVVKDVIFSAYSVYDAAHLSEKNKKSVLKVHKILCLIECRMQECRQVSETIIPTNVLTDISKDVKSIMDILNNIKTRRSATARLTYCESDAAQLKEALSVCRQCQGRIEIYNVCNSFEKNIEEMAVELRTMRGDAKNISIIAPEAKDSENEVPDAVEKLATLERKKSDALVSASFDIDEPDNAGELSSIHGLQRLPGVAGTLFKELGRPGATSAVHF